MNIRFAAVGLNHGHIYSQVDCLRAAGAELITFYALEDDLAAEFTARYPNVSRAATITQILEDESIQLVTSASIPIDRAPLGIQVMQHGKDYLVDKPGFTTLEQLEQVRAVQQATGRFYTVFFSERLAQPATVKASELVSQGVIGRVYQTIGFGPHRIFANPNSRRPDWFFDKQFFGGIINDIASHQVDQFLHFTLSKEAVVVSSQTANINHPQFPKMEDFGDLTLRSSNGTGYIRVDWFTPDGLNTWGDVRLFLMGTDGYIELRKNCDIEGRTGSNHLFLANHHGVQYIDCSNVLLPFGTQFINDIRDRTEKAITQAHCFLASELALVAQANAVQILTHRASRIE